MHDALTSPESIGAPRALVVGDIVLDRYIAPGAGRKSTEAPFSLLRPHFSELRPGGAANVACLLRALGARVAIFGLIGDDPSGKTLRGLLDDLNVEPSLFADDGRVTIHRQRIIGRAANQPRWAAGMSHRAISRRFEDRLLRALTDRLPQVDVLLISDYRMGLCTRRVLALVIDSAADLGIPILVAPAHGADYARYRRASLLTLNHIQAQVASGVTIRCPRDALTAGRLLREQSHVESVLITLDAEGMALIPADGQGMLVSTRPRHARCATPPGDPILAVVGFCAAAGIDWPAAAKLAGAVAGDLERAWVSARKREEIRTELIRTGAGKCAFSEEFMTQNGERN